MPESDHTQQDASAFAPLSYISSLPSGEWCAKKPRSLVILGSTGSIGRSALDVVRLSPGTFHVAALAGARNLSLLARQAAEFRPEHIGVLEESAVHALREMLPQDYSPIILHGQHGYESLARLPGATTVLSAQVGAAGLRATFAAVESGKVVALANKESLVLAGDLIRAACRASGASILPVDSEHNAIFQCLSGELADSYRTPSGNPGQPPTTESSCAKSIRIILTASGGPFFGKSAEFLHDVAPEQALAHPNWSMGAKITIDSATMMNKGLEIIEAAHLYGLPLSAVDVLVHKESIIHSLVEFSDHSQLAQLGQPDMRIPIACCLGWPERLATGTPRLDLAAIGKLTFEKPDYANFPCLNLAREAQRSGKGAPVILNAANEEAVAAFLDRRIGFMDIPATVEESLSALSQHHAPSCIDAVLALDKEARWFAQRYIGQKTR